MQHFSQWQILDFQDLDKEVDSDSDIWNNTLRIEYQNRIGKSTFVQSMAELSTTSVNSTDYDLFALDGHFATAYTL